MKINRKSLQLVSRGLLKEVREELQGLLGGKLVSRAKMLGTSLVGKVKEDRSPGKPVRSRKAAVVDSEQLSTKVSRLSVRRDPGNNYFDSPDLVKADLKHLDPEDPVAVQQFTDNITYAQTRVPRQKKAGQKDAMAAQDYMFRALEKGSYGPESLPLIAKLARVDELHNSNSHLRTLRDVMCMGVTTRLAGLPGMRVGDVTRLVKSEVRAESRLGNALKCRSSWLGAASPEAVIRLAKRPETLNDIIDYRSDLKDSTKQMLESELPGYERQNPDNRHLKKARKLIEKLMSDRERSRDDFEVSRTFRRGQHELERFLKGHGLPALPPCGSKQQKRK